MARLSQRLRFRRPIKAVVPAVQPSGGASTAPEAPRRDLSRELGPAALAQDDNRVSRLLYERLNREEILQAQRRLFESPEFEHLAPATADVGSLRMLTLHVAMWHRLEHVSEKTGLRPEIPPEEVHAMARGPLAAAGGLYEADLVAEALASAGAEISRLQRGLDFGCSSGRVVRVLAAAYPDVEWLGCDPNADAIAWARKNLPGIEFFRSGNEPPLPVGDGSLDFVFAISIWSHFEPKLGLKWFEEMRRVLAPRGYLMLTTHGLASVAHYAGNGLRLQEQCEEIADALYRRGWWYAPEFGKQGDWGVRNPAWGTSFMTPEWLLSELCPSWRVLEFAPGRNAANQDVYVLQRV